MDTRNAVAQVASFDEWLEHFADPELVELLGEDELRRIYEEGVLALHRELTSHGTIQQ